MHLVHHTLNLNGVYTGGKRNTLPFEEKKKLTDKLRHKKISQSKTSTLFSPLKTNGRKNDYESPIHGVINSA